MNKISLARYIGTFFLIFLFANSIFAFNIDYSRIQNNNNTTIDTINESSNCEIQFADTSNDDSSSDLSYIFNSGGGCHTKELPKDSVQKIWDDILVKGYKIDVVGSNQDAKKERDSLENNEALITEDGAKAGDMAIKKELPNQIMDPLETPTLLGQQCNGSFSYGTDLDSTLRVGRCNDGSFGCYTRGDGLFRQNGLYSFWKELGTVGKDALDMLHLRKAAEFAGEAVTDNNYSTNVDLGIFSDMSLEEVAYYKQSLTDANAEGINVEKMNAIVDKAIENVYESSSFDVYMETTCKGDYCYINSYSLFDKMFNQYFSADMVLSSAAPAVFNMASVLLKGPIQAVGGKIAGTKLVKENVFLKNIFRDPVDLIQSPKFNIENAINASANKSKFANFIDSLKNPSKLSGRSSLDSRLTTMQNKGIDKEVYELYDAINDKKTMSKLVSDNIVNNGYKLDDFYNMANRGKGPALVDMLRQPQEEFRRAISLIDARKSDPVLKSALDKINKAKSNAIAGSPNDWIKTLTSDEYKAVISAGDDFGKLGAQLKKNTFDKFKFDDGTDDLKVITDRMYTLPGDTEPTLLNTVISTDVGNNTGKLTDKGFGKAFEFEEKGGVYSIKKAGQLKTIDETITFADGQTLTIKKIVPQIKKEDTATISWIGDQTQEGIERFAKENSDMYITYLDNGVPKTKEASYFMNKDNIKSNFSNFQSMKAKLEPLSDADAREFGIDPIETAFEMVDNIVSKNVKDGAEGLDGAVKATFNKEWTSGRGVNWLNKKMSAQNGKTIQRIYKRSWIPNFVYWQMKTGFATTFGSTLGLTRWSRYQLPESYSALHIDHEENGQIYNDSYVDFFANDGSDQGDLFMEFFNSIIFLVPWLTRNIVKATPGGLAESLDKHLDDILMSKIKRDQVDNIALYTDTQNSGCGENCTIVVDYKDGIEKITKENSMYQVTEDSGLIADLRSRYTNQQKDELMDSKREQKIHEMDAKFAEMEESLEKQGLSATEIEQILGPRKQQSLNHINQSIENERKELKSTTNSNNKNELTVSFNVPFGINVNNYVLENTSKENLEEIGQNIITYSHHTNYNGITLNETSENPINLVDAQNNGDTCEQRLEDLHLAGMPIGWSVPNNYRVSAIMSVGQALAYTAIPTYVNSILVPAMISDIPQQFLIMPQIQGCVDDKEGYYSHFFVSRKEENRLAEDTKNQVGNMINEGVEDVEESLSNITLDTELESTVRAGTSQIKEFVNENVIETPIVQAKFTTSGNTDAIVNGKLFFFELGPGTKCRANNLVDKGVEILENEENNMAVEINKEKGTMSIHNEDGTTTKVIGEENKEFVRLSATNLAIPAKIIPHSLSYIPVPDTTDPLFEIDVYGNLYVKDESFFGCLKNGYEAQTGNVINDKTNNLVDYLGKVKTVNTLNSVSQYNIYPQNNRITAQGTPRKVADGANAKIEILGNRDTILGPVDGLDQTIGKNIAIQFENGQLIYDGETNSYIMWVEYTSITHNNDIKELKTTLVKTKAENGCTDTDEIAIDFKTIAQNNDQAKANVDKLNNALEKVGPFQMFDTETKTFIFYVSAPPECEQRMKIIDKETGEVYDKKITKVTETPDGLSVETEDGSTHDFEFNADNGVPQVKYNGETETLVSAQGKNGSFWYDPISGNWYTENGHMLPFNNQYKEGMMFAPNKDGSVVGTPASNVFNIGGNDGSSGNRGYNIPLTPDNFLNMVLYLSVIMFGIFIIYIKLPTNKSKKKL